ncbi:MAG: ATP-binding protein [Ferruginibacter sp.]
MFIYTILCYCCVGILLVLFFSSVHKIVLRYNFKKDLLEHEIADLRAAHDITFLQADLDMREYTFQNISREIHDNIGQKLSLAKLLLYAQMEDDIDESKINNSILLISQSIDTLADISHSMKMAINNNDDGLIKSLESEVEQLQRSGLSAVELKITGDPVLLDKHAEMALFRIAQEALQNINKHANASSVSIRLRYEASSCTLTIDDNGQGMPKEKCTQGTGINNIRNRTATLLGCCSINSNQNGTQLTVHVPLKNNAYAQDNPTGR